MSDVVTVVPSNPARVSIWYWVAPPVATPPGSARLSALPVSCAQATLNQSVGAQGDPLERPDADERHRLEREDRDEPRREHRPQLGDVAEEPDQAGQHDVQRDRRHRQDGATDEEGAAGPAARLGIALHQVAAHVQLRGTAGSDGTGTGTGEVVYARTVRTPRRAALFAVALLAVAAGFTAGAVRPPTTGGFGSEP